jgi:hypothetical protein
MKRTVTIEVSAEDNEPQFGVKFRIDPETPPNKNEVMNNAALQFAGMVRLMLDKHDIRHNQDDKGLKQ